MLLPSGRLPPGVPALHLVIPEKHQHTPSMDIYNAASLMLNEQTQLHPISFSLQSYHHYPGCLPKSARPQFTPRSTIDKFCLLMTTVACPQNTDLLAEDAMALSWVGFFAGWRVGISDSFSVWHKVSPAPLCCERHQCSQTLQDQSSNKGQWRDTS